MRTFYGILAGIAWAWGSLLTLFGVVASMTSWGPEYPGDTGAGWGRAFALLLLFEAVAAPGWILGILISRHLRQQAFDAEQRGFHVLPPRDDRP